MHVSAAFDSGNIEVVDASDPRNIQLRIRKDAGGDHMQWFYFRLSGARGTPVTLRIVNARDVSYPQAWPGYQAVASEDQGHWYRVPTAYEGGELVITTTPTTDAIWFAYFAPYTHDQHQRLVAESQSCSGVRCEVLGQTLDGYDLDLLVFGEGPLKLWIIARQHPGETMAEWWMEGFLERMLDASDALARSLRERATFYVVPNMNPDGSRRGHLRNNAAGANLNREWEAPTMERSPEVKLVRDRMDAVGVDFCLDVHGDEELPYNFIMGAEGIPGWNATMADLKQRFVTAYQVANPDFQTTHGYPMNRADRANMTMCTTQIAQRFDCLSMTLEQPFKDTADTPSPDQGWSPRRARLLGASVLHPLAAVIDDLR